LNDQHQWADPNKRIGSRTYTKDGSYETHGADRIAFPCLLHWLLLWPWHRPPHPRRINLRWGLCPQGSQRPAAKAKPKVYDNDNLPKDDKLSVVGEGPAAGGTNPADAKDAAADKTADDEQAKKQTEWKSWQDKLSAQKNAIDLASRELDVLQKEYQLRAAAMYADVGNRMRNATQWDKEDADYKQKIADKQKAVDDAKQKLDDIQEEARKAGVPADMREP